MKAPWQAEGTAALAELARPPIPEVYLGAAWRALEAGTPVVLVKLNMLRVAAAARSMGSHPAYHVGWYALGETLLAFAQGMLAEIAYLQGNEFTPVHHERYEQSHHNRNPNL